MSRAILGPSQAESWVWGHHHSLGPTWEICLLHPQLSRLWSTSPASQRGALPPGDTTRISLSMNSCLPPGTSAPFLPRGHPGRGIGPRASGGGVAALTRLFLFSHSVVSDSLPPRGLQHARLPCPSPSPGIHSNSCPLSQ